MVLEDAYPVRENLAVMKRLLIAAALIAAPALGLATDPISQAGHNPFLLPVVSGGGASCGSDVFAEDNFTEASTGNISLESHTKTSGGTWVGSNGQNATNGLSLDRANDVVLSTSAGSNGAAAVISEAVTCYDYYTYMSARTGSTGSNRIGPMARFDLATGNGYWLRITGGGDVDVYVLAGGSATVELCSESIAALVGSFSTGTNYDLVLNVDGSTISATINDIPVCSVTDTTYTTGKPGIKITNTAPRGDNFEAAHLP